MKCKELSEKIIGCAYRVYNKNPTPQGRYWNKPGGHDLLATALHLVGPQ